MHAILYSQIHNPAPWDKPSRHFATMGRRYLERRLYNEKKSKPFKRQRDPKWNNNPVYDVAHEKAYKDFDGEAQYFETLQKLDRRRRNLQVPLRTPTPTLDITTGNLVDAITTFGEVDLEPGTLILTHSQV